ncbi:MAG: ribosome biogenesis GTPase Der [Ktedonobacterales bacterium]|nr:ribosome biogenesis GTPase Der [Ktedonobacterales bacterium]
MKPLVAIVGRPNVGKSTFFNRMIGQRLAIVEDEPGTTRDRIYGDAVWNGREFTLIDTGGLELDSSDDMMGRIRAQAQLAVQEADVIIFLVDGQAGVTAADSEIAQMLRRTKKPIILGVNKADNAKLRGESVDFYSIGIGEPITLSSRQGVGTGDLLDAITEALPPPEAFAEIETDLPKFAIVGRPNVGKSSLLNSIIGQDRAIVSEIPGTTRDALDMTVTHRGLDVILIDTAGVRRRGKIDPGIEKYAVLRSERAIERCDVAMLIIDATEGVTAQDTHIAGVIHEEAKGVVVVINKWDLIREQRRELAAAEADPTLPIPPGDTPVEAEEFRERVREDLKFIPYASVVFISAKTRYHVDTLLDQAIEIASVRQQRVPTAQLNELIRDAVLRHPPAAIKGRQLKVLYATQAEINPPTFVIFVNDADLLHFGYERYLENQLRREFSFPGTAIRMRFRSRQSDEHTAKG